MKLRPRSLCISRRSLQTSIQESTYLRSLLDPKVILSTLGFQINWWQLLVFVSQGMESLGCLISLLYICFHVLVIARSRWQRELLFIGLWGVLGWMGDFTLVALSVQKFPNTAGVPFWLLCMWLNYMTSIHYSMAQIFRSRWLTLFVGFIFGPWTYLACWKMGLVEFPLSAAMAAVLQGFIWMAWMWCYRHLVTKKIFA